MSRLRRWPRTAICDWLASARTELVTAWLCLSTPECVHAGNYASTPVRPVNTPPSNASCVADPLWLSGIHACDCIRESNSWTKSTSTFHMLCNIFRHRAGYIHPFNSQQFHACGRGLECLPYTAGHSSDLSSCQHGPFGHHPG